MSFANEKKVFLSKLDKSNKSKIDKHIQSLINIINQKENYYTTSSCSGRVYLRSNSHQKDNIKLLKISHDLINTEFFNINNNQLIWLQLADCIVHVACKDLDSATKLLNLAKSVYKQSNILTISNKIILEIKGSQAISMPLFDDNKLLFNKNLEWLRDLVNNKLVLIHQNIKKFEEKLK